MNTKEQNPPTAMPTQFIEMLRFNRFSEVENAALARSLWAIAAGYLSETVQQAATPLTIERFIRPGTQEEYLALTEVREDGTTHHRILRENDWVEGNPLPHAPGAYWRPEVDPSEVWTLTPNGRWNHNLSGDDFSFINPTPVPDGLQLLGLIEK